MASQKINDVELSRCAMQRRRERTQASDELFFCGMITNLADCATIAISSSVPLHGNDVFPHFLPALLDSPAQVFHDHQ